MYVRRKKVKRSERKMGQYYVTAVKTDDGKTTIYNRYLLENGKNPVL